MLLQEAYKAELASAYGIHFNSLLALNNIPIKRYADYLIRQGELHSYMQVSMCRSLLQLPTGALSAGIMQSCGGHAGLTASVHAYQACELLLSHLE